MFSEIPIIDFTPFETYLEMPGGLYGNNDNTMPSALSLRLLNAENSIVDKNLFISIGMSNTNYKFDKFVKLYQKKSKAVMINCAIPGKAAESWSDAGNLVWSKTIAKVNAKGVNNDVQVVWMELADRANVSPIPTTLQYVDLLKERIKSTVAILHNNFPKLKVVYISPRTYGGYAVGDASNGEPYAYATGFAVQQAILELMNDSSLPVTVWANYWWADGLNPNSEGLIWERKDFGDDGMHPSGSKPYPAGEGTTKCANLLYNFFKTKQWFNK